MIAIGLEVGIGRERGERPRRGRGFRLRLGRGDRDRVLTVAALGRRADRGRDGRRNCGRARRRTLPARLPEVRRRERESRETGRDRERGPPAPIPLARAEHLGGRARDERAVDGTLIARVAGEQRAIRDDVDEPRDAA